MKIFFFLLYSICLILLIPYSIGAKDNLKVNEEKFKVSLEKRIPSDSSTGSYTIVNEIQEWNPKETAIIICDMWNEHWCKGATDRVTEMAPFMNKVVSLAREKGILIVHENMCVIGRSFGLRNMVRLGMNVVVMRDLTDTMYNSKQWPVVSHFTGTSLMTEYIETYVCSSMVSCDFTGQKQFRFKNDNRQIIAFIIAENEYQANQTLPEFDQDVLGGNYQGHYGTLKVGIEYSVVPGMENHPLFKGISTDDYIGPVTRLYSLYKNRPLRSPDIQVLLLGTIPDRPSEPVLWINNRGKGNVIYTSLGHWEDWKNEKFRRIMFNAVDYLLKKQN